MHASLDVAKYLLSFQDSDAGDLISNLKLQKLLYYAQGNHLAVFDAPLFAEPIEAWMHGPVVPNVYHVYKHCGDGAIPLPDGLAPGLFHPMTMDFLNEVNSVYGQFSAWKLRNMTHEEAPWLQFKDTQGVITHASMAQYFKTVIK